MYYGDSSVIRYTTIAVGLVAGVTIVRGILNKPVAKARRAGAKLPPGPKRDPLIGNLRNFPKQRWYETFTQWREEFGA
jgi:hypothetical protein